ncbi:hypothetical protein [Robertmurraya massiliosenegalensis]|uniref:hypothetical protein n=1 Tax=Robertmurraya massiliosenegalensis TaxID=1287657 RepID=UPI0002F55472|nr:hypothetical protein [Robertmurraya massiliosenegalensis]
MIFSNIIKKEKRKFNGYSTTTEYFESMRDRELEKKIEKKMCEITKRIMEDAEYAKKMELKLQELISELMYCSYITLRSMSFMSISNSVQFDTELYQRIVLEISDDFHNLPTAMDSIKTFAFKNRAYIISRAVSTLCTAEKFIIPMESFNQAKEISNKILDLDTDNEEKTLCNQYLYSNFK